MKRIKFVDLNLKKSSFVVFFIFSLIFLLIIGQPLTVKAKENLNKTILFVRNDGKSFEDVQENMAEELKQYNLKTFILSSSATYQDFAAAIKKENPSLVVLMDNKAINFATEWNKVEDKKVKGIGLMGLNLSYVLKNNPFIAGIAFEPPAYTLFTQFRYHTNFDLKKVIVFYRKSLFSEVVEQAAQQLKVEKIDLTAIDVEQKGNSKEDVAKFISEKLPETLSKKDSYDAVWCLLDSVLLGQELFSNVWVPQVRENNVVLVTGVEQLVMPQMEFGIFAVTPSLPDLAGQAVQIVERIFEEGESPESIGVEQVLSVDKVLNKKLAEKLGLKIDSEKIYDIKVFE